MALIKVQTKNGWVEGLPGSDRFISVFKGIPYAAPPVGENRWRRPQPAASWEGVRQCFKYQNRCLQEVKRDYDPEKIKNANVDSGKGISACHVDRENSSCHIKDSEDCLYLNIWTPAEAADEKLPVAVWIHGGGLYSGSPYENIHDGEAFAKRGLVFVSVSHRLNMLGFFAHPELEAEDPDHSTGNYGMLDLVAAIEWIRENIAAFGGNPERISIFGQSGGADKVQLLACSPLMKGKLSGAIMQSAGGIWDKGNTITREDMMKLSQDFLDFMGCKSIAEARRIPEDQLIEHFTNFHNSLADPVGFIKYFFPIIDNYFMTENPNDAILAGHHPEISYMVGSTSHEFYFKTGKVPERAQLVERFKKRFGEWTDRIIDSIHLDDNELALKTTDNIMGEEFVAHDLAWNENEIKLGRKNSYSYYIKLVPPGLDVSRHVVEIIYIFNNLAKGNRPFKGRDYDLSNQLCEYWSNFFKYGDPNGIPQDRTPGVEIPEWKPLSKESPDSMIIDYDLKMGKMETSDFRNVVKEFILQQKHW